MRVQKSTLVHPKRETPNFVSLAPHPDATKKSTRHVFGSIIFAIGGGGLSLQQREQQQASTRAEDRTTVQGLAYVIMIR